MENIIEFFCDQEQVLGDVKEGLQKEVTMAQ